MKTLLTSSLALGAGTALAADHLDSPSVQAEAGADINDLYAFVSPGDPDKITLIMTVNPLATAATTFSDAVTYTFHVQRVGDGVSRNVVCTFEAAGTFSCVAPSGAVASGNVGVRAAGDSIEAWTGLRDDPFFFDLAAFQRTVGLNDDANNFCLLDADAGGNGDFFATLNVMAIVVEIRKEVFIQDSDNEALAIWASTSRRGE